MKTIAPYLLFLLLPFSIMAFDSYVESNWEGPNFSNQTGSPYWEGPNFSNETRSPWECCTSGWEAEFRVAAFYPQRNLFRRIYGKWSPEYQLEVSKQICGCNTYGFLNIGWYSKRGHSVGLHNKTRIRILPVSFGVKQAFCINSCLKFYLGIGATYAYMRIKDYSRFVYRHTSRGSWGGIFKSGFQYDIWNCAFLDFFVDYLYQPVHISKRTNGRHRVHRNSTNIGGLKIGGGIGWHF